MGQYFGIEGSFRLRETIEKSVFITTLVRVETPEEAAAELKRLRAEFSDATHNCYAYVVGEYKKSSDDGEPQGTAGRPMAQVLEMRGCDYMLAVVTRYFGGVKLGAAGLVSAYSGCVARALDKAALKKIRLGDILFRLRALFACGRGGKGAHGGGSRGEREKLGKRGAL